MSVVLPISLKVAASKATKSPSQPVVVKRMRSTEEVQPKAKKMEKTAGVVYFGGDKEGLKEAH